MFKKIISATALGCALLIVLMASGCANRSWAVKVNGVTEPTSVYLAYLYENRVQVLSQAASSSSSSAITITTSSGASSTPDPWKQQMEGQNAVTWAMSTALKATENLALLQQLSAQQKVSLSAADKSSYATEAGEYLSASQYAGLKANGVTQSALENILGSQQLSQILFDSYYDAGGTKAVSAADRDKYYTGNFVDLKQIVLLSQDDNGNALPDAQIKTKEAAATEVYNELKADPSKFSALLAKYNEDPGMTANPEGYLFAKNNTEYIQDFTSAGFSMKVGDVKEIKESFGWEILYKVPLPPTTDKAYTSTIKEAAIQSMKSDEYAKFLTDTLAKAKIVKNDSTLNHYNPETMKDQ
jgi:hypothetical protein